MKHFRKMCCEMRQTPLPFITFCTVLIWLCTASGTGLEPVVKTSLGSIQGKLIKMPENNVANDVYEFIGIPYAQPPIGKLRFKIPEPIQPWTGIYKADKWSGICLQTTILWDMLNVSYGGEPAEDCLYLNIWTPSLPTAEHKEKKAVMVYIHGGAFKVGSASQVTYHGAILSSMGDVVVVTINYRLGILGFLNLGTEQAPGNQGLWDQRLALMWVQEHVQHFGGDRHRVTIFGESAGSMSVGAQLLSPMSQGLFQHAIMQSGSPLNHVFLNTLEMSRTVAIDFATEQGCYNGKGDTKDEDVLNITDCLREIDSQQIIQAEDYYYSHQEKGYIYPTYGDEFFPHKESGNQSEGHQPVDLMIGFSRNEGSIFLILALEPIQREKTETIPFTLPFAKQLPKGFLIHATEYDIREAIRFYYGRIPESASPDDLKETASDLLGDYVISCPAMYFAESFSEHHPVYFYQFSHRYSGSPFEEWAGVAHGDELPYIFQASFFGKAHFTEEEMQFHRQIVDLWTTFAKTGKPQVPGVDEWPLYSEDHPVYVDLKHANFTIDIGPRLRECNFWRCHMPKFQ